MSFGSPRPNVSIDSTLNEQDLSVPGNIGWPSPHRHLHRAQPRAPCSGASRTRGPSSWRATPPASTTSPVSGCSNTDSAVYYSGTLAKDPSRLHALAAQGAQLVVTDTNRKQAFRWDTLTRQRRLHRDAGGRPGQDRPQRQPHRAVPGHDHLEQDVRDLRGRGQRHGQQLRQLGLLHAGGPAYSAIDDNLDTAWITGTFVPDPAGQWWQAQLDESRHDQPHHPGPAPARRPRPLGVGRHPDLRRQGPGARRPDLRLPPDRRPDRDLPVAHVPHPAGDHRRHHRQHGAAAPRPPPSASPRSRSPASAVHQVIQMPTQMLTTLGASSLADRLTVVMTRERTSPVPAAQRPRDDHHPCLHAAHRPHLHAVGQRQPLGPHPRRRDRPARGAHADGVDRPRRRLLVGPAARRPARPPPRPRSTGTPRRPGSPASAPTRRSAPRSPTT